MKSLSCILCKRKWRIRLPPFVDYVEVPQNIKSSFICQLCDPLLYENKTIPRVKGAPNFKLKLIRCINYNEYSL